MDAARWCGEGRRRCADSPLSGRCQLWLFATDARAPDVAAAWRLRGDLQRMAPGGEWRYLGRAAQKLGDAARRLG